MQGVRKGGGDGYIVSRRGRGTSRRELSVMVELGGSQTGGGGDGGGVVRVSVLAGGGIVLARVVGSAGGQGIAAAWPIHVVDRDGMGWKG